MIPVTSRKGQRLALFGLGGSGMVTAEALVAGGAEVTAFDDNPGRVSQAQEKGIPTGDLREVDFSGLDALVLSPGVPLTHPKPHWTVELAHNAGIPVIGDVGLFAEERHARAPASRFIAITGTNGKSTTTALVSHMLTHAGLDVQMGGNIGRAVLSLDDFADGRVYVVECSSYQIDLAPGLDPTIGLLLNLAPDHLDRHGTMERYAAIKARLVEQSDHAVIGMDDRHTLRIAESIDPDKLMKISVRDELANGIHAEGETIVLSGNGARKKLASVAGVTSLRGRHNLQNAAMAVAVCRLSGVDEAQIQAGLETFPGLAHRMEVIGSVRDVLFINDSKGTNADAAAMALASFRHVYWIAGGLAKEGGIEPLRPYFGNIVKAYLIGEAAPEFAATLGSEVAYEITETLDVAVQRAATDASADGKGVVLLSPACASFDQFANFEVRGDSFRKAVLGLPEFVAYGETL